ncbi:Uncharacterized protein DBV15_00188 [Temnothorax longispinosus]|uniref:Uncharacterized protein n=1 Tax=Temnothorax longispinosus TaxID=300112 RepID=A0A4S2KDX7_9HYME|nr:Uncharacterized protein DBV15_00188 [Temnothorax longispinosus]
MSNDRESVIRLPVDLFRYPTKHGVRIVERVGVARRRILLHVRFKGLTTEAKLSRSLSLSVFRVVFEISGRVVTSIRKDHRDDRAGEKS